MVTSFAIGYIQSEIIRSAVSASLYAALWPIALLRFARIVDNPFSVAKARSDKAGLVLADAIINRAQGRRPLTLVGFSLGARIIYTCLLSLAERGAFGLVENAVCGKYVTVRFCKTETIMIRGAHRRAGALQTGDLGDHAISGRGSAGERPL